MVGYKPGWAVSAIGEGFLKVALERPRERKARQRKGWPSILDLHIGKFMTQQNAECSLWAQQAQIFEFYEDVPVLTVSLKI